MGVHHQGAIEEVRVHNGSRYPHSIEKRLSIPSVLVDAFDFWEISEESDGRGRKNHTHDRILCPLPNLSPPFSHPCLSASPFLTPRSILSNVSSPLSAVTPGVDLSSTRTSIFFPAMRWLLSPPSVASCGTTR